jgi:hypothetical protein
MHSYLTLSNAHTLSEDEWYWIKAGGQCPPYGISRVLAIQKCKFFVPLGLRIGKVKLKVVLGVFITKGKY